jgi:hypothetical protein
MRKLLLLFLILSVGVLGAQEALFVERTVPGKKLWRWSVTSLAVANALDVQSSWGKHELNPALAGPGGTFGRNGALLKIGFQGGLLGVECLLTRGHPSPKLFRVLSVLNFGISAGTIGVAAHNYTIPRPN